MMIVGEVKICCWLLWRGWGFCGCGRGTRPACRAERFLGGERGRLEAFPLDGVMQSLPLCMMLCFNVAVLRVRQLKFAGIGVGLC